MAHFLCFDSTPDAEAANREEVRTFWEENQIHFRIWQPFFGYFATER